MIKLSRGAILSVMAFATLAVALGHGCSDVRLVNGEFALYKSTAAGINFCTTKSDTITSNLKFIFVVDRSGSNQNRYTTTPPYTPLPATDPNGTTRFGAITTFVQNFQSDPNIYWSMVSFASGYEGGNSKPWTNNKSDFLNFVADQQARTQSIDGGDTNYLAVLNQVNTMISNDVQAAQSTTPVVSSQYVVFFVSDGAPLVNNVLQNSNSITAAIQALGTIATNNKLYVEGIQLNTGYYTTPPADTQASQTLQGMALTGGGNFLQFSGGQQIDFSRYAIPVRVQKFVLKDLWVVNENTIWYNQYNKIDSDGDGLPDDLEIQLGSDPFNPDSDGNGVSDGVEYRISGKPCKDATCSKSGADPYTSCQDLQQPNGPTLYKDTDGDYLNDCEERLLGSDPQNFDSNGDYIPDDMAFRFNVALIGPSNVTTLDPDNDGVSNYQELKLNTPLYYDNRQVPGLQMMSLVGQKVSSNLTQDCFNYNATNITTRSNNDLIRIYLLQDTQALSPHPIMRVANLRAQGGAVSAQDSDFVRVGGN